MSSEKAAEEPAGEVGETDAAAQAAAAKKKRKKLLIIGALLLLVLGGGGFAAWTLFKGPSEEDHVSAEEAHGDAEVPEEFVDVPAMQVALRGADGSSRMLKLHVMLVPGDKTPEEITPRLPLLVDRFQPFLRELRPEDLAGSAATFRIKEELLIRANQALGPRAVRDVLIQDLMQS